MKYTNDKIRRQDRLLSEERARELLKTAEYAVLSMQNESRGGYGVPINYVWDGEEAIYLHCAPEGKKLNCISACPNVTFCLVGSTNLVSSQFTTEFESVLLDCTAKIGLDVEEKTKALELMLDKYSPRDKIVGLKYIKKSFHRTEIIKLDIKTWSGKAKSVKKK